MTFSFIIPTLNEAGQLPILLAQLAGLEGGEECEVIVADGGSSDATVAIAEGFAVRCVSSAPGRARQMNAGAAVASGDVLVFVHADTRLPAAAPRLMAQALKGGRCWGRFDLNLSGAGMIFRLLERLISWRSRLSGIVTGDQVIFVQRQSFVVHGGYPDQPLMEDIALSRILREACGWPACISAPVTTSSRRWEKYGILRTVLLMWRLRLAYFLGASPAKLALQYRRSD